MKKFSINELISGEENTANIGQNVSSPSTISLSSTTSINHPNQSSHPSERFAANSSITNMTHTSDSPRSNHFYQNENEHTLHNDNINWRDEADGSEEEESRLNIVPSTSNLPSTSDATFTPTDFHNNQVNSHLSFNSHLSDNDARSQPFNNCNAMFRANSNFKSSTFNTKVKQLHEAETYLNRIDSMVQSFKKLLKTNENNQHNHCVEDNFKNSSINHKTSIHSMPKMAPSTSNSFNSRFSNFSNQYSVTTVSNNLNLSKAQNGDVRNNKNRKQSNNRPFVDVTQNEFQSNNLSEADLCSMDTFSGENNLDTRVNHLFRSITNQIKLFRRQLEQLAVLNTESSENSHHTSMPANESHVNNLHNNHSSYLINTDATTLCDLSHCNTLPLQTNAMLHASDNTFSANYKMINQQIHQLLLLQNNQITQQHQLIMSWMCLQQKWFEKQTVLKSASIFNSNCSTEAANTIDNAEAHEPSVAGNNQQMLNNQTVPTTRANNFWDNFKSQSYQNKLQSNLTRDMYSFGAGASGSGSNCTNHCVNSGTCTKNSRSQSFSHFNSMNNRKSQNTSTPNGGDFPYQAVSKLNTNVEKNMQQLTQLLNIFEKQIERIIPNNSSIDGSGEHQPVTQVPNSMSKSAKANRFSPLSCANNSSGKSGLKRKKVSNIDLNGAPEATAPLPQPPTVYQNDQCDCDYEHCIMNSTANLPEANKTTLSASIGNRSKSKQFNNCASGGASSSGLFVPFHISPCTGAIRKKPIFSDRDTGTTHISFPAPKLTRQLSDTLVSSENVRPLMPAEGRSSETKNTVVTVPKVTMMKMSNSQKMSTRPPITGAGNEISNKVINLNKDLKKDQDTSSKWTKVDGKDCDKKMPFEMEQLNGEHQDESSPEENRISSGSNSASASSSEVEENGTAETEIGGTLDESTYDHLSSSGHHPKASTGINDQSGEPPLMNGHNGLDGSDSVVVNGHAKDEDTSGVGSTTVRLSGDGEQGL